MTLFYNSLTATIKQRKNEQKEIYNVEVCLNKEYNRLKTLMPNVNFASFSF